MSDKLKILFKAPIFDFSGYATAARHLLLELYKQDVFDLFLDPVVWVSSGNLDLPKDERDILDGLLEKSKGLTQKDPENMTLVHFSIATEFFGENSPFKRTIGLTMLETDKTTPMWAHKCNCMDCIFTPSTFCLSSFMQSSITTPINVIPFGIDFDKYTPEGEKLLSDLPTKYNFLTVGQWLSQGDRKNIVGVIRTFLSLFKENKDVGLILKTYHESAGTIDKLAIHQHIEDLRAEAGLKEGEGPQIYLVHGAIDEDTLIKLYRSADAFLSPSAGEAWGMPLLEAAAMELPIITTGGTGAESFLNPEYTVLLEHEWQELGHMIYWPNVYEHYQKLTIPNMEEFSRMVNRVYKNPELSKDYAKKQRAELIENDLTWKNSAKLMAEAIQEVWDYEI